MGRFTSRGGAGIGKNQKRLQLFPVEKLLEMSPITMVNNVISLYAELCTVPKETIFNKLWPLCIKVPLFSHIQIPLIHWDC